MHFVFVLDWDSITTKWKRKSPQDSKVDILLKPALEHLALIRAADGTDKIYTVSFSSHGYTCQAFAANAQNEMLLALCSSPSPGESVTLSEAVRRGFLLLREERLASSCDNYGKGRLPWQAQHALIYVITTVTQATSLTEAELRFDSAASGSGSAADQLTAGLFRDDQRVFAFCLAPDPPPSGSAVSVSAGVDSALMPISPRFAPQTASESEQTIAPCALSALCDRSGGKAVRVNSPRSLLRAVEASVFQSPPCVMCNFRANSSLSTIATRCLLVERRSGFWPIPESFAVTTALKQLPARESHALILYGAEPVRLKLLDGFPFDRYVIAGCGSAAADFLPREPADTCRLAFVHNSAGDGSAGKPFAVLKRNRQGKLCLYVLPYNFPVLFELLDGFRKAGAAIGEAGRRGLEAYLASVPRYYLSHLHAALSQFGIGRTDTHSLSPSKADSERKHSPSGFGLTRELISALLPDRSLKDDAFLSSTVIQQLQSLRAATVSSLAFVYHSSLLAAPGVKPMGHKSGSGFGLVNGYQLSPHSLSLALNGIPPPMGKDKMEVDDDGKAKQHKSKSGKDEKAADAMDSSEDHDKDKLGPLHSFSLLSLAAARPTAGTAVPSAFALPAAARGPALEGQKKPATAASTALVSTSPAQSVPSFPLVRNPFDIRRRDLFDAMDRLRLHVLRFAPASQLAVASGPLHADGLANQPQLASLLPPEPRLVLRPRPRYDPLNDVDVEAEDAKHSVPVAEMGNYVEALKKQQTLRDPFSDDDDSARRVNFGNPFKARALGRLGVDEADDFSPFKPAKAQGGGGAKKPKRRKRPPSERPSFEEFLARRKAKSAEVATPTAASGKTSTGAADRDAVMESEPAGVKSLSAEELAVPKELSALPMSAPQWVGRRKRFWQHNKLFLVRTEFTTTVRSRNPDIETLKQRLLQLEGEKQLVAEFIDVLAREAQEYNRAAIVDELRTIQLKFVPSS